MAYEIPGTVRSVEAAGDLTTSFYQFVKLSGATLVAVSAATDAAYGVLQNKPSAAGAVGAVMISGISRVKNGVAGALAAGVAVYLDATGRVTTTAQAGKAVGVTLTACSNQNDLVAVEIKPLGSFN